jgi:nucleotide-binding universal stress UspA family protein
MKTIIASTDFTPSSVNAVNYAADLALSLNAKLVLLNVVEIPMAASEVTVTENFFEEMAGMADQDLENLKNSLMQRSEGKLNLTTKVVLGSVAAQIKEVADELQPFAIVMGKRAGNSLERILLGSSTLTSVKHNPYPILIIPEHVRFNGIHKIALACDLQNVADTIPFKLLTDWISPFNPSVQVVHLSKREQDFNSLDATESVALENHLSKYKPTFHFLVGDKLAERLNSYALEQKLDLLVIVPKKHGFLALFDKKHSGDIIIHNNTAILAIHGS